MTEFRYCPIYGRLHEILKDLMHTSELMSHPSLVYAFRLVSEEIIVNIIHYAYLKETEAYLVLIVCDEGGEISIEFRDGGKPFNPLEKELPDVTLPPECRAIGGLGIFLVREMMDEVNYTYTNRENRLVIRKKY